MCDAETSEDIATVNLNTAVGLPEAERLGVPQYLERLQAWTQLVGMETERWLPVFHRSPGDFDDSLGKFRMLALVTVLQRDLGVRYDPACREGAYCALDSRTLFIHGLLDGQGGTCVTMPVLYIAVGRRLGYPLYLVQAREHLFVRWEEDGGERFNIEATSLGFVPRDDDYYRCWPKPICEAQIRQGYFLQNLSARGERAAFLRERGQCWLDHLRTEPALESFVKAAALNPCLPGIECVSAIASLLHRAVVQYGRNVLFATPPAKLRLLPAEHRNELQVWPLALEHLQRIVTNFQQRQRDRLICNPTVYCQI